MSLGMGRYHQDLKIAAPCCRGYLYGQGIGKGPRKYPEVTQLISQNLSKKLS